MSETRKPPPSPARRCDDIIELIDAVLATASVNPARHQPVAAVTGSW